MTANLEYYKVFFYVASELSLTKAAELLNISQPAVSQSIKNLESQLNVKLITGHREESALQRRDRHFFLL